jgi:AcrR family transcriptional regulator
MTVAIKKTKKEIILQEAASLIRDKGYVAMTMRDLATQVGMEAASLYNHIKSKEEILHEICFSLADIYTDKMDEVKYAPITPIEKIKAIVELGILINTKSAPVASVMNDEWRHLSSPEKERFLRMRKAFEDSFIEIIQEGIDIGEIREVDPSIALYTILSSMRWLQHWYYSDKHIPYEDIKSNIVNLIFTGIDTRG